MTQSYWPFDGVDTNETQYSQLFRRMSHTGVWADPDDSTLKVTAASGMNVSLALASGAPAFAFVRGHMYTTDAAVNVGPFDAAPASGQERIDSVVLRLDPSANTILPTIVKGSAAASGQAVAPTIQASDAAQFDLLLGDVLLASGTSAITNAMITDRRRFAGMVYGVWKTRPTTPRDGQPGWNATDRVPEFWDKTAATWKSFILSAVTAAMIAADQQALLSVGNAAKVNGIKVTSGSTQPTNPTDGDLWFTKS